MNNDREFLTERLKLGVFNVTFTKVDGTERTMPCTLNSNLIPLQIEDHEVVKKPIKENLDIIKAYVTDIKEWRSFRVANVKAVEEVK